MTCLSSVGTRAGNLRRELQLPRFSFDHQLRRGVSVGQRHGDLLVVPAQSQAALGAPRPARDLLGVFTEDRHRLVDARVEEQQVTLGGADGEHVTGGIPSQVRELLHVLRLELGRLALSHLVYEHALASHRLGSGSSFA